MASQKARAALANLCLLRLKQLGGRATAREIAADLGKAVEFIQPRMNDLLHQGRVRDTKLRVRAGRGRPQVVWADADSPKESDALWQDAPHVTKAEPVTVQADEPSWFSQYGQ